MAVITYHDPKQPGEERVSAYSLYPVVGEVRADTQYMEPGSRNWGRGPGGVLPTGFFLMTCSACFLYSTLDHKPGLALPIVSYSCPINQQSGKCTAGLPTGQSNGDTLN